MTTLTHGRARGWTLSLAPLTRHFRNRAAVRQLRKLDDHLLRDIGLMRADIEEAVNSGRA